jgi:hypothetical protein
MTRPPGATLQQVVGDLGLNTNMLRGWIESLGKVEDESSHSML